MFEWPSQALMSLFALSFYLFGLWFFHYTGAKEKALSPCDEANLELRLVVPFTLPFLFFTLLSDLLNLYPDIEFSSEWMAALAVFAISLSFLAIVLIFFPPILQWVWQCRPLPSSALADRLEALCQRANFKHAGMRIWTIMPNAITAAIIGVVPRFRYVMFTERLLRDLSPESVEAVLAHEIGHSYRKHLILYPFIIFGMLVCTTFFSNFVGDPLAQYFSPSPLSPLIVFAGYAIIIALYFRLVFGFFSRQFERQADLHIFALGIPAEAMKEALLSTGMPPTAPSWHHYSIQERIDFLDKAAQKPALISRHHRNVKIYFLLYLIILGIASAYLMI